MTSRNQGTFSREEERGPWERGCMNTYFPLIQKAQDAIIGDVIIYPEMDTIKITRVVKTPLGI